MEGQKCNLIATFIPLDRTSIPLDRTFLPLDHTFLPFDCTFIPLDRTFLPFDRTSIILSLAILHWFIPVAFHIYPYFCGNSIPSDHNYRIHHLVSSEARKAKPQSCVRVEAMTYDYMTYN